MNNGKVTFTEDFLAKTKKTLSRKEKGRLLKQRFASLSIDQIKAAKSRKDIASMVGYTDENMSAGVLWVARMIKHGELKEEFYGYGADGKIENIYDLPGNDPRVSKNVKITEEKIPEPITENISASITVGEGAKISIENISVENLAKLINSLK